MKYYSHDELIAIIKQSTTTSEMAMSQLVAIIRRDQDNIEKRTISLPKKFIFDCGGLKNQVATYVPDGRHMYDVKWNDVYTLKYPAKYVEKCIGDGSWKVIRHMS